MQVVELPRSNVLFPVGTMIGERLLYIPSAGETLEIKQLSHISGLSRRQPDPTLAGIQLLTTLAFTNHSPGKSAQMYAASVHDLCVTSSMRRMNQILELSRSLSP